MYGIETIQRLNAASPDPTRCRPGDLAIIVTADYKTNLGRIVRIIKADDESGDIHFQGQGTVWFVECAQHLTWTVGKHRIRRKYGPARDSQLQPIRGEQLKKNIFTDLNLKAPRAKELEHVLP